MLGTVYIMEGTCSKLFFFFVRSEQNEWHRHVYENACVYVRANATHMVSVSVCLCLFMCGASAMKVNAWTCAPATDRDLDCWDLKDGACSPRTVKSGETLVDVRGDTDVQIVRYTWVQGRQTNRTIRIIVAQQLYQVKRMIGGIGNVPCSTYCQTQNG